MSDAARELGVVVDHVASGGQGAMSRPTGTENVPFGPLASSLVGRSEAVRPVASAPAHSADTRAESALQERTHGPAQRVPSRIVETTQGPPIGSRPASNLPERTQGRPTGRIAP